MSKFDDYFGYSKREKRGIIVLSSLIIVVMTINSALYHQRVKKPFDFSNYENEINELMASTQTEQQEKELFYFDPNTASAFDFQRLGMPQKTINSILNYRNKGGKFRNTSDVQKIYNLDSLLFEELKPYMVFRESKSKFTHKYSRDYQKFEPVYFEFDPNTVSAKDLEKMGVKDYVAQNIVKFRENGGRFYESADLLKIYGFNANVYNKIEDYIKIDTSFKKVPKPVQTAINLNLADATELRRIRGIGEVFADRIINYRTKLGGFLNFEQLNEIYGMHDDLYNSIIGRAFIDSSSITKININEADYKTLVTHPYITKLEATAILNYRDMIKHVANIEELRKQKVLDSQFYNKIEFYLCTE